ncbi:MAG: TonB-dependent receptor [Ignavibacteriales bacterium]|nr:TonB-dependent receptor [Ignavibacteriales bacterium]
MRLVLTTIATFVVTLNLFAQEFGAIEARAYDRDTKEPLANALIRVVSEDYYATTDAEGTARLKRVRAGEREIRCRFVGYATATTTATVKADETSFVEFAMNPEATPLREVEVTATRGADLSSPVTFSNLPKEELQRRTVSRSIPAALSSLPSTTYHSENGNGIGYTYLRIRGFDQRRISVLINGVPQNDPEDHIIYWINFYDLSNSLQDVQVQRGAGAAFYGPPAIGGSVNLETKIPSAKSKVYSEFGYGSYETQRYTVGASSGLIDDRWYVSLRGSRVKTDGYRDWSWSEYWRFFGQAGYLGDDQSLKLTFFGGPQEDALAFYGVPKDHNDDESLRKTNYGAASRDREVFNQPQFSAIHDYRLSDDLTINNTVFYIAGSGFFDFDGSWGTPSYYRLPDTLAIPADLKQRAFVDNDHYGWYPRVEWRQPFGTLIVGGEWRRHRSLHWGRIESATGLPDDYVGEEADYHFYEYKGGKDVFAGYASWTARVTERVTALLDAQVVYQEYKIFDEKYVGTEFTTPYLFANPKIGASFRVTDETSVYASVARSMREPPLKNLYDAAEASWGVTPQFTTTADGGYDFDDPLVEPEKLADFELGARAQFERFRFDATLYLMEFEDEIVPSGGLDVFGQPRVGNAERTRHVGVELSGATRLARGFDLSANLALSRNRFVEFVEYDADENNESVAFERDGNYIANAPELIANAALSYATGRYAFEARASHVGEQFVDNTQSPDEPIDEDARVDPYTLLDFSASYEIPYFRPTTTLSLEVNNLLDSKVLLNGFGRDNFFPAATRNYFLKLRVEY